MEKTVAFNVRLAVGLKVRAVGYADSLGLSLNGLIAVALKDYLDARQFELEAGNAGQREVGSVAAGQTAGDVAIPRVAANARCPCGSGRKYKKCHGKAQKRGGAH
jgi:hypothetical protein